MRAFLSAALLGFATMPSYAQAVSSDAPSALGASAGVGVLTSKRGPSAQGKLTGHVICADTRRPARGALVMVIGLPSDAGATPSTGAAMTHVHTDGSFAVDHLAPGEYTAIAVLPGYLSALTDFMGYGDTPPTSPAQQRELLTRDGSIVIRGAATATFDLTLQRGAALSGQVLYSDGTPAAAVSLLLEDATAKTVRNTPKAQEQQMAEAFADRLWSQQSLSTDDQGHFRLAALKPGTYRLAAVQPVSVDRDGSDTGGMGGLVSMMGIPDANSLHFYVGDTIHRAAAKTFELRRGDEVSGLQITLPLDAFHQLHGTVIAKDGRTVNQGQITLTDTSDPQLTFHTTVADDGTFLFAQVPAGSYTLAVTQAHTTESSPDGPARLLPQFRPRKFTAAFADADLSVIVQDHDFEGAALTVTEIPMPKDASPPALEAEEP